MSVSRPRKKGRDGWPPNLYINPLRYRNPDTKVVTSWRGYTLEQAIEAAKHLNSLLMKSDPVADVIGDKETFLKFINTFRDIHLKDRREDWDLSKDTVAQYQRKLATMEKWTTAKKLIAEVTTKDLKDEINDFPTAQRNRYRSLLTMMFDYAINDGLISSTENPARPLIKRKEKVKRRRLTIDWYNLIYERAEAGGDLPTCRSMRIALRSLQRREDLVSLKFTDITSDARGKYLPLVQHKTKMAIKIYLDNNLEADIEGCRETVSLAGLTTWKDRQAAKRALDNPYILKYPFLWQYRHRGKKLMADRLTKGFQEHRDALDAFKDMPAVERPTFHEIRALGAILYLRAGKQLKEIQALLGHATENMTRLYLSRHGVEFTDAETGKFSEQIEKALHEPDYISG